jgi:hypothetical protein
MEKKLQNKNYSIKEEDFDYIDKPEKISRRAVIGYSLLFLGVGILAGYGHIKKTKIEDELKEVGIELSKYYIYSKQKLPYEGFKLFDKYLYPRAQEIKISDLIIEPTLTKKENVYYPKQSYEKMHNLLPYLLGAEIIGISVYVLPKDELVRMTVNKNSALMPYLSDPDMVVEQFKLLKLLLEGKGAEIDMRILQKHERDIKLLTGYKLSEIDNQIARASMTYLSHYHGYQLH